MLQVMVLPGGVIFVTSYGSAWWRDIFTSNGSGSVIFVTSNGSAWWRDICYK